MTTKKLTRRQARWSLILSEYDFVVQHRAGKLNGKADSLSRRPDYEFDTSQENKLQLLPPSKLLGLNELTCGLSCNAMIRSHLLDKEFDPEEDWPLVIAHRLLSPVNEWLPGAPGHILDLCKANTGHFRFRGDTFVRILADGITTVEYVPSGRRMKEIRRLHVGLAHLRYSSLIDIFKQRFWWPDMDQDIKDAINRCPECQLNRSNSNDHAPQPIRPLAPTALPFERWGIDFVQNLSTTKAGNRHIITAIDYASRWVVAKPVPEMNEDTVATFFVRYNHAVWYAPADNHGSWQSFLVRRNR